MSDLLKFKTLLIKEDFSKENYSFESENSLETTIQHFH